MRTRVCRQLLKQSCLSERAGNGQDRQLRGYDLRQEGNPQRCAYLWNCVYLRRIGQFQRGIWEAREDGKRETHFWGPVDKDWSWGATDETCLEPRTKLIQKWTNFNDGYSKIQNFSLPAWIKAIWDCQSFDSLSEAKIKRLWINTLLHVSF